MELTKLTENEILALTIIGEARGEPIEGQVAVGSVIRNRLHNNPTRYKRYHDVCLEPYQFSCWNVNDPNRKYLEELAELIVLGNSAIEDAYLRQCIYVANGIKGYVIIDNTGGALYYMTKSLYDSKRPSWARSTKNENEFGKQIFFNV